MKKNEKKTAWTRAGKTKYKCTVCGRELKGLKNPEKIKNYGRAGNLEKIRR